MKTACKNNETNLEEKKCPPRKENVKAATLTSSSLCRQLMAIYQQRFAIKFSCNIFVNNYRYLLLVVAFAYVYDGKYSRQKTNR